MRSFAFAVLVAVVMYGAAAPRGIAVDPPKDAPKDTAAAELTRTKALQVEVTVDFNNEFLGEALKEISAQVASKKIAGVKGLKIDYLKGVSGNTRLTFKAEKKTVEAVLDGMLGKIDRGYFIKSKEGDKKDGWIIITGGTERGWELPMKK